MSLETPLPGVQTKATSIAIDGMGRGLFAPSNISTGEDVVKISSPFVAVLNTPQLDDTCSGCLGKKHALKDKPLNLKACTGCQVVKYCDKVCQAKDWKTAHSAECKIFKTLAPRVLPINARAMLRIILRMARQKYTREELYSFAQLETHLEEIHEQRASQWERIELSAKAVKLYSMSDIEEEAVIALGAQVELNAFNFTDLLQNYIGVYVHPYAALINHSCDYNSVVVFDGEEVFVKAVRPISNGEQIFISYIDATNPSDVRRKELLERYFFHCQCSKCLLGTDAPGDGYIETTMDHSVLGAANRQASISIDAARDDMDAESALNKLKSAKHALRHAGAWPITRQPYIALRDELITTFLSFGDFQTAFAHAAVRHVKVDPFVYPISHPIRYLHSWTLVKLAIHLGQGIDTNSDTEISIEKFGIEFDLLAWFVLCTLIKQESESCIAPRFKMTVTSLLSNMNRELSTRGLDPAKLADLIKSEWLKVDKLIIEVLGNE